MIGGKHSGKIQVVVRKRPASQKEQQSNDQDIIEVQNETNTLVVKELKQKVDLTKYIEEHKFNFDRTFSHEATNEQIYQQCVQPIILSAFKSYKVTVFAYGQTGSGKTYTMLGDNNQVDGLYLLASYDIFNILEQEQFKHLTCWVSFYEIYCGKLFDLLNDRQVIQAREDQKSQINIVGLQEKRITSVQSLMQNIELGTKQRITGSNSANADSSRSHAILQINLREGDEIFGKMSFIDLAGSERGADVSGSDKQTRQDGAEINKSLLALKECIRALDQNKNYLPFRGSKLTLVLKDSFIGNCKTIMIGNISPCQTQSEHTLNTLRYADRVKELRKPKTGQQLNEQLTDLDILAKELMLSRQDQNSVKYDIQAQSQFQQQQQLLSEQDIYNKSLNQQNNSKPNKQVTIQINQNQQYPQMQQNVIQQQENYNNQKKSKSYQNLNYLKPENSKLTQLNSSQALNTEISENNLQKINIYSKRQSQQQDRSKSPFNQQLNSLITPIKKHSQQFFTTNYNKQNQTVNDSLFPSHKSTTPKHKHINEQGNISLFPSSKINHKHYNSSINNNNNKSFFQDKTNNSVLDQVKQNRKKTFTHQTKTSSRQNQNNSTNLSNNNISKTTSNTNQTIDNIKNQQYIQNQQLQQQQLQQQLQVQQQQNIQQQQHTQQQMDQSSSSNILQLQQTSQTPIDDTILDIQNCTALNEQDLQVLSKKHESLISKILAEEEDVISSHRFHIDDTVELVKEEMHLIGEVDKPGSDVDSYLDSLNQILDHKMSLIKQLKNKISTFKTHLTKEDSLSKRFQIQRQNVMNSMEQLQLQQQQQQQQQMQQQQFLQQQQQIQQQQPMPYIQQQHLNKDQQQLFNQQQLQNNLNFANNTNNIQQQQFLQQQFQQQIQNQQQNNQNSGGSSESNKYLLDNI